MKRLCGALLVAAFAAASPAGASPPLRIHYQGIATDALGDPLLAPQTMTFRLCDALSGGTCHWTETKVINDITSGVFSTELGDTTPLNLSDFDPIDVFIELEIGISPDNEILVPRQRIASVPYALQCTNADRLEGVGLVGLAAIMETQVLADNVLSFPTGPTFAFDNALGQQRFEISAGLASVGPLAVGSSTNQSTPWSSFGANATAQTQSGSMDSVGDLFVEDELEVGGALLLSRSLYMEGNASPGGGGNQSILFYDNNNRANEFIRFEPATGGGGVGRFVISEPILAGNNSVPAGILYHRFSNDSTSVARSRSR